jgi:glyoxylase-like metal-dependent hydrolase (beta-lactamase superfamily II)
MGIYRLYLARYKMGDSPYDEHGHQGRNNYFSIHHKNPAMEIIPGIHKVDGVNGNAYILIRDGLVIIDAGIPGSGRTILSYIRDILKREPADIRTIILTHFHSDHIGGVRDLKKTVPQIKTAVHEADAGFISGKIPLPRYKGFKGLLLRLFSLLRPSFFTPDILLKDGDRIEGLTCIHLPGHTPGSIGLLDENMKCIFAGDILRSDGKTLTAGPAGFTLDPAVEQESIRKLADLDFDLLLVGHGKPLRPQAAVKVREYAAALHVDQ